MMEKIRNGCLISLFALCMLGVSELTFSQAISPVIFGQNAWMPDTIGSTNYGGKLHKHWGNIRNSGASIIRFGGIAPDYNKPTNYQYIRMIDSIRNKGMEPLIQVPYGNNKYNAQTAANIVQYVNVTMGRNVIYWSIGNEPDLKYGASNASQVAPYIKAFATAMKAVDPNIKIAGPDCAWFNKSIYDGLTTPGGSNDITGKDASGRFYLDIITYHTYPFSGSQTRSQVISKLSASGSYQDNMAYLKGRLNNCNTYHNRTGSSALQMGITEANISYKNSSGDNNLYGNGTNSFIAGQFIAEMLCLGMKNGLDIYTMWSVVEGSSGGTTNIGYIDPSGNKKPCYYHFKLVADNFKGSFANGSSNISNVKAYGSKDAQEVSVLIMNQESGTNYNYTVRLNTSAVSATNPLKINIDAGVAQEYTDAIQNQSSVLLTFNSAGTLVKKCVYSISAHAASNLPPACTTIAPPDNIAPTVSAFSPADNATNVSKTANLVLTFIEPVQKGSGNIIIKEGGTVAQTIAVSGSNVTISGGTVTIDPADFSSGSAVSVEIAAGAFKDSANNNYSGITVATAWNFTIGAAPDVSAPTVASYTPSDNATNIAKTATLEMKFSEPVQKGSGKIFIKESGILKQTIDVTDPKVSVNGNTVTIDPSDFAANTPVNVELQAGIFKDMANNPFAGISDGTTWNFTTRKNFPTVIVYPPSKAVNVAENTDIILVFTSKVNRGSGTILIKENGIIKQTILLSDPAVFVSGNEVTINPADFSENSIINIEISEGSFTDGSGAISEVITWDFSTGPSLVMNTAEAVKDESLKIYPSPSQGKLTFEFKKIGTGEKTIEIANLAGQIVQRATTSKNDGVLEIEFDAAIPNGFYLVRIRAGSRTEIQKILLER